MIVYTDIQNLPIFKNAVITIGVFDGVHTGHQQIISLMKAQAEKVNGETVLITFDPHPGIVLKRKADIQLLTTFDEKVNLLQQQGIDHLVAVPFTEAFAEQTADEYIEKFLVNTFHPHTIVIGHDHRFGKGRSGDFKLLEEKAKQFNFIITEIDPYILQKTTISSTSIRKMLLESNVEDANTFLGYDYFFSGMVVSGNKMGRTIGYPTANIILQDKNKLVPGNGVYAVKVMHNNFLFSGMMNIGIRPTVAGINRVTEVNIFDFDKEIYGDELTVTIKNKLRNEIKFDSLNGLKNQLERDKQAALQFLNSPLA